jgi:hypothetical protein
MFLIQQFKAGLEYQQISATKKDIKRQKATFCKKSPTFLELYEKSK